MTIKKDSEDNVINFYANDIDSNAVSKTISVVSGPHNGVKTVVAPGEDTHSKITYTPNASFVGEDRINFQLSDGTTLSNEKTVYITIK